MDPQKSRVKRASTSREPVEKTSRGCHGEASPRGARREERGPTRLPSCVLGHGGESPHARSVEIVEGLAHPGESDVARFVANPGGATGGLANETASVHAVTASEACKIDRRILAGSFHRPFLVLQEGVNHCGRPTDDMVAFMLPLSTCQRQNSFGRFAEQVERLDAEHVTDLRD